MVSSSGFDSTKLCCDSYIALALQPRCHGCRNKDDVRINVQHALNLIDQVMFTAGLAGGPIKLLSLTEGSIQGFWDEQSDMDQEEYCNNVAITLPGPESELLAEKARQYGVYLAAQAKVIEPEIRSDRYLNTGFIISPEGEIILKHRKNIVANIEGSTTPYDIWDDWSPKVGSDLASYYPVVRTDIGNLGIAICAETRFPETFRALQRNGAEVIIKMALAEPAVMDGQWEVMNRARAIDNICYIVAPNIGPYKKHPDMESTFSLAGGKSMIVDYRGNIVRKLDHGDEGYAPGEINIKGLREYRTGAAYGLNQLQVRSGLWRQIYDSWPDYPKNAYMEKALSHKADRIRFIDEMLQRYLDAGIYTPYERQSDA